MRPSVDTLRELYYYSLVIFLRSAGGRYMYPDETLYTHEELTKAGLREPEPEPPRKGIYEAQKRATRAAHLERLRERCCEVGYVPTHQAVLSLDSWKAYRAAVNTLGGAEALNRLARELGLPKSSTREALLLEDDA